ncbi:polypyrimidine tract-binding protein 1 [Ditylenchus destructor]|uniref:Polypyrimidine tract-binding protein 1 n=1 Tax=Ditylenchus destructor TaxID=166010 RepID=A0AAD4RD65_9BILA|nr:polypyrimidine tract-binding protein 1 [Ditylenchus destructor]
MKPPNLHSFGSPNMNYSYRVYFRDGKTYYKHYIVIEVSPLMPKRGSEDLLTANIQPYHCQISRNGTSNVTSALFGSNSALLAAALHMTAESEAKKAKFESSTGAISTHPLSLPCSSSSSSVLFSAPGALSTQNHCLSATALGLTSLPPDTANILATLQLKQQLAAQQQIFNLGNMQNAGSSVVLSQHLDHSENATRSSLLTLNHYSTAKSTTNIGANQQEVPIHKKTSNSSQVNVSRVVHLRNIPSDMTELEVVHFCLPFGRLVNYLMLKGKNQAFVEYEDESGAQTLVAVADACPMAIRGRTIFCQFSTHQELKTDRKGATKDGSIFDEITPACQRGNLRTSHVTIDPSSHCIAPICFRGESTDVLTIYIHVAM